MKPYSGRVFKIETMGAVDGPGIRLVLFLSGCPLRCPYCHNPEGWDGTAGEEISVDEAIARYRRYEKYYRGGGITLSGGEPLAQAGFALALLRRCKEEGIHTALDTSGCVGGEEAEEAFLAPDLALLDIKHQDPAKHLRVFGFPQSAPLRLLALREAARLPVWIRHVAVPGLTAAPEQISRLAELLKPFSCVQKIDILPLRKLCIAKYEQMGIPFPLRDVPDAVIS